MKRAAIIFLFFGFSAIMLMAAEGQTEHALTCEEAAWARVDESGRMVAVPEGVFRRGETVNLVLRRVKTLQAGKDGKCHFDIDLLVQDPAGITILEQNELLGEKGHIVLKDGVAASPYGIFESRVGLEPGRYQMTLVVRDKISGARLPVTRSFTLAPGLSYQKALFARSESDGSLSPVAEAVFSRGETVNLVLVQVGRFKKDAAGKHFFEIGMLVKDPAGATVLQQDAMLGEKGHAALADDIAETPYGMFYSSLELAPGVYTMTLSIFDKIAGDQVSVTRPFTLK